MFDKYGFYKPALLSVFVLVGVASMGPASAEGVRFALKHGGVGQCLDVKDFSTGPGALVQVYSCAGTTNQLWSADIISYDGDGGIVTRLINANSGLCLDLSQYTGENGIHMVQNICSGSPTQNWKVDPPVSAQTVNHSRPIRNTWSGKCLAAGGQFNPVSQRDCGRNDHHWRVPLF